jgi:hypothetical protein
MNQGKVLLDFALYLKSEKLIEVIGMQLDAGPGEFVGSVVL